MPRCAPAPSLRTEPQNRTRRGCRLLVRRSVACPCVGTFLIHEPNSAAKP